MIKINKNKFYGHVYIRVFPNNKVYIGQTIQPKGYRQKQENWAAKTNKNESPKLYRALRKYNYNTKDYILAYAISEIDLNFLEKQYIKLYNSVKIGYNILYGGYSPLPKYIIEKMSKANKTKKRTKKWKENISNGLKKYYKYNKSHRYGRKLSDLHRFKISKSNKGKKHKLKSRKKISKFQKNKGLFGFYGSFYMKSLNFERKCWRCRIGYDNFRKDLGLFEDPLSAQIVYEFVWNEIYGDL